MHVLLISADCAPNPGGVAAHVLNLAKSLCALHIDITVIGGTYLHDQISSFKLPFPHFHIIPIPKIPKLGAAYFALQTRSIMKAIIKRSPVDITHIHTLPCDAYPLLGSHRRMRHVATNHSSGFLDDYAANRRQRLYKFLLGHFDAVIAPSRELAMKSTYLGVPADKIHYIPNGVDTDRFTPGNSDESTWDLIQPFTKEHSIVLATRRLEKKNGVHFLLQAMPSILKARSDARLILAGDGPDRTEVEQLCRSLGMQQYVRFLGTIRNDKLPNLYRIARVCTLPSLQEATSISGLEAMATGCPLVGTRVGGIPELIENENTGILVEPGNPLELSNAVIDLLNNPQKAATIGASARERAQSYFSWNAVALKTLSVYQSILQQS